MNEAAGSDRLILTTETPSNLRDRVLTLLFCAGLAAALTSLIYVGRDTPIDGEAVLCVTVLQIALLGAGVGLTFDLPKATWVLDNDGVTYYPRHGRSRTVPWSSVDRLQWGNDNAFLKGGNEEIVIPWRLFEESQRTSGRAFAEAKLISSFDVKDVARPDLVLFNPEWSRAAKFARLAKLFAIGFGLTVPCATVAFVAIWVPPGNWVWFGPLCLGIIVSTLLGPYIFVAIFLYGEWRRARQIHPKWPWRLRRTKVRELVKVGAANDPWLDEV